MKEQLTGRGGSRHTKGMPDNPEIESNKSEVSSVQNSVNIIREKFIAEMKRRARKDSEDRAREKQAEKADDDKRKAEAENLKKELQKSQDNKEELLNNTPKDTEIAEVASLLKDVPEEEISAYVSLYLSLKDSLSGKGNLDKALAPGSIEDHSKAVKSISAIQDISDLRQFVSAQGVLQQRFIRAFTPQIEARAVSSQVSEMLQRAELEHLEKVKKILQKVIENKGSVVEAKRTLERYMNDLTELELISKNAKSPEPTSQNMDLQILPHADQQAPQLEDDGAPEELSHENNGTEVTDTEMSPAVDIQSSDSNSESTTQDEHAEKIWPVRSTYAKPDEKTVRENAQLNPEQRLKKASEITGEKLSDIQQSALLESHNVGDGEIGKDGTQAEVYNYNLSQIRQKARKLRGWDEKKKQYTDNEIYTREQRRALMEAGLAGADAGDDRDKIIELSEEQLEEQKKIARNTETMARRMEELLGVTRDEFAEIQKINDVSIPNLITAMERMSWSIEDWKSEAEKMTRPDEVKLSEYVRDVLENGSIDEIKRLFDPDGVIYKRTRAAIRDKANELKFKGGVYNPDDEESGTKEMYRERKRAEFEQEYQDVQQRLNDGLITEDQFRQEMLDIQQKLSLLEEEVRDMRSDRSSERGKKKTVENMEELMGYIMELHPGYELIHTSGEREGQINQGQFIEWIRDQLTHYHNQDADNPQVNFFGNINVEIYSQGYSRTVSVIQMINQPGVYFENRAGRVLLGLRDEVERTIWQYSENRNNNIAFIQSMPMDTKIADVVGSLYAKNALTKPAYEGKSPFYWNLTQSENYEDQSRQDARVGEGIVAATMLYYDITDFEALKRRCKPIQKRNPQTGELETEESPLFDLNKIKDTARALLAAQGKDPDDKFFPEETWAELSSFFDENGKLKKGKDYIKFFNPYEPSQDSRKLLLFRSLITSEVSRRTGLSAKAAEYAEQWAQFQINFMLISARGGVGARAFNGAEKGLRMLEYYMRAWSASKPGLGNPKALGLLVAPGVDFLAGTQVRASYDISTEIDSATDSRGKFNAVEITDGEDSYTLSDDEEIVYQGSKELDPNVRADDILRFVDREVAYTQEDHPVADFPEATRYKINEKTNKYEIYSGRDLIGTYDLGEEEGKITYHIDEYGDKGIRILKKIWNFDAASGAHTANRRVIVKVDANGNRRFVRSLDSAAKVGISGKDDLSGNKEIRVRTKVLIGDVVAYTLEEGERAHTEGNEVWIYKGDLLIKKVRSQITERVSTVIDQDASKREKLSVTKKVKKYDVEVYLVDVDEEGNETVKSTGQKVKNSNIKVKKERVIEDKMTHRYTSLHILNEIDKISFESQKAIEEAETDEEKERLRKVANEKVRKMAGLLEYDADEQKQFAQNQFSRAMGLFHEYGQKFIVNPKSYYTIDYDKRMVFEQDKLQEEIGEKLVKPRRYGFRTWAHLDMSEIVRAPDPQMNFEYRDMHRAEAIFGKMVIEAFRRKDGTIDWEFINTQDGKNELLKTEMILRLAADEAYHEDIAMLTPKLGLEVKVAYRKGVFTLSDEVEVDHLNVKNNKVGRHFFGARQISFNEYGKTHEQLYESLAGSLTKSYVKHGSKGVGVGILGGAWEAAKDIIGGAFKS